MKKTALPIFITAVLCFLLASCNQIDSAPQTANASATGTADVVLVNGKVYTGSTPNWAEAIAVKDQRISFVGSSAEAEKLVGAASQRIDLGGRMLMPGIIDAHLHPLDGALKTLYRCNFPFTATPKMVQDAVSECVKKAGDRQWIVGGQWDSDFFLNHKLNSPRKWLDSVSGDKAVFLRADSGHDGWLNSKALSLAGINRDSVDPEGGTIVRNSEGAPNGVLLEKANYMVIDLLPAVTEQEYLSAAQELMRIANGYGVTAMKDASAEESDIKALQQLASQGKLTAHMASAINVNKEDWQDGQFKVERFKTVRDQYTGNNVDARFIKIFLDGVPTSSRTAAMLADYLPAEEGTATHSGGDTHYTQAQLDTMLTVLDSLGFTVKVHTAGDRSVRMALDAIEKVRNKNGNSALRHELAHAGYIDTTDIPRFSQLNAVADLSPYLWHPSPIIDSVVRAVGPRAEQYWPVKTLMETNAPILAGSDWPSAVATMNPWNGLEALVTRADPSHVTAGTLWKEEAVSLEQAVEIYTHRGAQALRIDEQTGRLAVGKLADFIVLNHNLFDVKPQAISDTEVLATYFEGHLVHGSTEWAIGN